METWDVYILLCSDETYYVGCTSDFEKRYEQHRKGYVISTKYRIPVKPITRIVFHNKSKAYQFEKYLKTGSGRAFMNKRLVY